MKSDKRSLMRRIIEWIERNIIDPLARTHIYDHENWLC